MKQRHHCLQMHRQQLPHQTHQWISWPVCGGTLLIALSATPWLAPRMHHVGTSDRLQTQAQAQAPRPVPLPPLEPDLPPPPFLFTTHTICYA